MRRNDFINNLIELSKKAYINKADYEDLDDIVYNILEDIDEDIKNKCIDDLGRDYLIDIYKKDVGEYYLKQFPNYNDDDLIFTLIQDIWDKEDIYSFFDEEGMTRDDIMLREAKLLYPETEERFLKLFVGYNPKQKNGS